MKKNNEENSVHISYLKKRFLQININLVKKIK